MRLVILLQALKIVILYFMGCFSMSSHTRKLEKELAQEGMTMIVVTHEMGSPRT